MVRQLPLLLLLFAGVLFWLGHYLESVLLSVNLENARRSGMVAVYAMQASMIAEPSHDVWDVIVEKVPRFEGTEIEILDVGGTVVYSTDPRRRGATRSITEPLCASCHASRAEAAPATTFLVDPSDQRYQVLAAPLRNESQCRTCHAAAGEKLGMVLVRQSLEPIHARVRTVQITLAFAGAIALALTLITTSLLLGRYLGRPLVRLVAGARAIGAGNLDHTIKLDERTELKELADTLNSSAAGLQRMVRRLERQRDDVQTLYRLVDQLSRSVLPEERRRRAVELAGKVLHAECLLVRVTPHTEVPGRDGIVTFREGEHTVERFFSPGEDVPGLPSFHSPNIVRRWLEGELDTETEAREEETVAYPLQRSGQRLGLLLRPAEPYDRDGAPLESIPDPEMVQALVKHVAIALEFSDLQRELVEEERLAAIGETVSGMAHWLKNTLNGLRAGQYVIDRAVQLNDTEKLLKGWRVMKNSIHRVEKLTADLLYCAKERTPERQSVDPNQMVREVVELSRENAAAHGVELAAELDETIGKAVLDRESIHRALLDLVTNAIEACAESESGNLVTLGSRGTPGEITLSVADNGIGMSDAVVKRLSTRFFSTKGSKGTGLGLMVVRKIVEEHGGALDVDSEPGRGSVFSLRIPRQ